MKRNELQNMLGSLLECDRFKDYCPNGLQVEGRTEIRKVVCGVTASLALIERAIETDADAILVHHGWFWRGEDPRVLASRKKRLAALLKNDINLFAYHLPLDAHPVVGNNVQLARVLGWEVTGSLATQPLVMLGKLPRAEASREIARSVAARLAREPLLVGDPDRVVRSVAWCTGGGQSYFEQAIDAGADLYLSGEVSEQSVHLANETGVPFIAAGHHATERYGIRALADYLLQQGIDSSFVDLDNPV